MTRTANARLAGATFLVYIAAGITDMILSGSAAAGDSVPARLASIAQHTTAMRISTLLGLLTCFCALILAVTLYAITRDEDPDLAMLGLLCRVTEGIIGAAFLATTPMLIWLATATGPTAPDAAGALALGTFIFRVHSGNPIVSATFFAAGSTMFCWLFLRGRMIPALLAWLGVFASVLLVVCLPLQIAGIVGRPITDLIWLPMLAFEVPLAFWLMIKGVANPRPAGA